MALIPRVALNHNSSITIPGTAASGRVAIAARGQSGWDLCRASIRETTVVQPEWRPQETTPIPTTPLDEDTIMMYSPWKRALSALEAYSRILSRHLLLLCVANFQLSIVL